MYKIYHHTFGRKLDITNQLIDDVRLFHETFYFRKWAQFDKAKRGTFNLIPNPEYLKELKKDYSQMLKMIYEKDNNINFDQIIETIREIQEKINI